MLDESKIHGMVHNEEVELHREAKNELGTNFEIFTDKSQATNALLSLTKDPDKEVRYSAAIALGSAFSHITDKSKATSALLSLTKDRNRKVRVGAAKALGSAFSHITDKSKATSALLSLTKDPDKEVRYSAAKALGSAFSHITDKSKATSALLSMAKDQERSVRWGAAMALGSAFSHITDKSQTTIALLALTKDMYSSVRAYANNSLGKAHIFKAVESDEENFKKELEIALEFFEKSSESSQEQVYSNPSKFCLPFYRLFYSIIYKKDESEAEIKKYLAEAKSAVGDSENYDRLLDALENLSNTLKETQKAWDFREIKQYLNTYRRYCEKATDLMGNPEDKAPDATKLIRGGVSS